MSLRNFAIEQKSIISGSLTKYLKILLSYSYSVCHFGSSGGPFDELETKIPLSQSKLSIKKNGFSIIGGRGPNQRDSFEDFETEVLTFTNLI